MVLLESLVILAIEILIYHLSLYLFLWKDKRWSIKPVVLVEGWSYLVEHVQLPTVMQHLLMIFWTKTMLKLSVKM